MKEVMIVDDSAMARALIKRTLEICGVDDVTIWEAANGQIALDLLKDKAIDLIFMDLNMPKMNGEQLLKRLKSSPKLNHIPVIVISSKKNVASEQKLIADNAAAVLSKPISIPELNTVLDNNLNIQ